MKKVCIVSQNPVKIEAVKLAFAKMFPNDVFNYFGFNAISGVKDQPNSDKETKEGSKNRLDNALKLYQNYEYYVSIEGGVEMQDTGYYECFAWIAVYHNNIFNFSKTGNFLLPLKVGKLLDHGTELGIADDLVFGKENSKQLNGSIGILTNDAVTRTTFYTEAVCLALIPFKNIELYT